MEEITDGFALLLESPSYIYIDNPCYVSVSSVGVFFSN